MKRDLTSIAIVTFVITGIAVYGVNLSLTAHRRSFSLLGSLWKRADIVVIPKETMTHDRLEIFAAQLKKNDLVYHTQIITPSDGWKLLRSEDESFPALDMNVAEQTLPHIITVTPYLSSANDVAALISFLESRTEVDKIEYNRERILTLATLAEHYQSVRRSAFYLLGACVVGLLFLVFRIFLVPQWAHFFRLIFQQVCAGMGGAYAGWAGFNLLFYKKVSSAFFFSQQGILFVCAGAIIGFTAGLFVVLSCQGMTVLRLRKQVVTLLLLCVCIMSSYGKVRLAGAVNYDEQINEYKHEIITKESDLDSVQRQITEMQNVRDTYFSEEKQIGRDIEKDENEITGLQKKIKHLKKQLEQTEDRQKVIKKKINSEQLLKEYWSRMLRDDIKRYYIKRLAFDDPDAREYVQLLYYRRIAGARSDMLGSVQSGLQGLGEDAARIEHHQSGINTAYLKKNREKAELTGSRNKKMQHRTNLRSKRTKTQQEIKALEETAASLLSFLKMLQDQKLETEYAKKEAARARKRMAKSKGDLPWPITGKVISFFGRNMHPELNTYIYNNGIKIHSKGETDVHAVSPGTVVFSGTFGAYGNMIVIDHRGGFYSVYGYLASLNVAKSQKVAAYEVIGQIDDSEMVLYFELRKKENPQDPVVWLQKK